MRDIIIVDDLATVTPVSGSEPTISGETGSKKSGFEHILS